jgi:phenylalanyl-tRNA synthetase alpha chain
MREALEGLEREALHALEEVKSTEALESWRAAWLGRRGRLAELMAGLPSLPAEQRPEAGREANRVKVRLQEGQDVKEGQLREGDVASLATDLTLPGLPVEAGHYHLATQVLARIGDIFASLGFESYESPEVESDELNFTLLNLPPHHPARDMWDTFYLEGGKGDLLRTHTSPGQIHIMRERCPDPIRTILPGKVFRYEQVTARSEMMFHQVEGLAVDKGITMTDLKGVLSEFARRFFGPERTTRFRASYFPFTEPSVEVDIDCFICGGKGCRICKGSGWLEIGGAGMVHPVVLRNGGYDPDEVTGFAFGMGLERTAMMLYGIDDIRYFFTNDVRFLEQF